MFAVFRILRALWVLFLIFGFGVYGLHDGLKKRHEASVQSVAKTPATITASDFVRAMPSNGWYRVTNCTTDATQSIFAIDSESSEPNKAITKVGIPVHETADPDSIARIVMVSQNEALCNVATELNGLEARPKSRFC